MASELKRGTIRVLSNYMRLGTLLVLGILFVPIFITGVGSEAFGLFGLLGSTMGFAEMCKSIVRSSMNRELGAAYNSADPEDFQNAYNAAIALTAILAAITALFFTALWFILPLLTITPELFNAARWLLVTQGCYSTLVVLLGPQFNMYLVSERLVLYNTWSTVSRAADIVTAIILFLVLGIRDPATGLTLFAIAASATSIAVLLLAVTLMFRMEPRLKPDFSRVSSENIRQILPTAWWNTLVVTGTNLHIRVDQIIMNLFFGLPGNAIWTLAVKLTSYVRMIAFGGTDGLDVVSARLSSSDKGMTVQQLMHHATRMHSALALPAGLVVFLLAEPLMTHWVSRAIDAPEAISGAVALAQILVIGMTARGISDCWTRILYGAGYVSRYGPLVIAGGITNPLLALGLIWLLPESIEYKGPAIAFATIFAIVHFVIIPLVAARCLSISAGQIFSSLARPAIAAAASSVVLVTSKIVFSQLTLLVLFVTLAIFATLHAGLCWYFVLDQPERKRLSNILENRVGYRLPRWAQA